MMMTKLHPNFMKIMGIYAKGLSFKALSLPAQAAKFYTLQVRKGCIFILTVTSDKM